MLSTELRSKDALSKTWLILLRGSSKAEEAEMWFSVRSSLLPDDCRCLPAHIWDLDSRLADASFHHGSPTWLSDLREGGMRLGFWAAIAWVRGAGRSQASKT